MTTLLFVASQKTDPKLRDALADAVSRVVADAGGQLPAAKRLGIDQSAVSDIVNKKRMARLDTIVAIRNALGVSLDDLLRLPPAGTVEPPTTAPLAEVLEFYRGRWDGLPIDLPSLAAREGVPAVGWKVTLDEMAALLAPGRLQLSSKADGSSPRSKGPGSARRVGTKNRGPR